MEHHVFSPVCVIVYPLKTARVETLSRSVGAYLHSMISALDVHMTSARNRNSVLAFVNERWVSIDSSPDYHQRGGATARERSGQGHLPQCDPIVDPVC